MDNEPGESVEDQPPEPQVKHTGLHIGGPLNGKIKFHPTPDGSLPESVSVPMVVANQSVSHQWPPTADKLTEFESVYELERIRCAGIVLTVYRYEPMVMEEMFIALLMHYRPDGPPHRTNLCEAMCKGVSTENLQAHIGGGFILKPILAAMKQMQAQLSRIANGGR